MRCGKLLIRAFRLYRDKDKLANLKRAKIEGTFSFIEELLTYFPDDHYDSIMCFLIFLETHDSGIYFAEEELNEIISYIEQLKLKSATESEISEVSFVEST